MTQIGGVLLAIYPHLGENLDRFCNFYYNFAKFNRIFCKNVCNIPRNYWKVLILALRTAAIPMNKANNPLKINVGFIVNADAGFQREFEFELQEVFLPPETQLKDLRGKATIGRTPQGLIATVQASARTPGECDRCLDRVEQTIATDFTELYAFDERSITESQLLLPKKPPN